MNTLMIQILLYSTVLLLVILVIAHNDPAKEVYVSTTPHGETASSQQVEQYLATGGTAAPINYTYRYGIKPPHGMYDILSFNCSYWYQPKL